MDSAEAIFKNFFPLCYSDKSRCRWLICKLFYKLTNDSLRNTALGYFLLQDKIWMQVHVWLARSQQVSVSVQTDVSPQPWEVCRFPPPLFSFCCRHKQCCGNLLLRKQLKGYWYHGWQWDSLLWIRIYKKKGFYENFLGSDCFRVSPTLMPLASPNSSSSSLIHLFTN